MARDYAVKRSFDSESSISRDSRASLRDASSASRCTAYASSSHQPASHTSASTSVGRLPRSLPSRLAVAPDRYDSSLSGTGIAPIDDSLLPQPSHNRSVVPIHDLADRRRRHPGEPLPQDPHAGMSRVRNALLPRRPPDVPHPDTHGDAGDLHRLVDAQLAKVLLPLAERLRLRFHPRHAPTPLRRTGVRRSSTRALSSPSP